MTIHLSSANLDQLRRNTATKTYTGGASLGQTGTNATIFTVTGEILVAYLVPFCTVNLGESGASSNLSLGVTNSTALFIASTAALDIDAGDLWVDATPTEVGGVALPATLKDVVITDNILTAHTGVGNTNAGAIRFDLYWLPLSADAAVT